MADQQKSIGIFGGTFDPIHNGHLRMAIECYERLDLAEVRFIPLNIPPHRPEPVAPANHRLSMLELALNNINGLAIDPCELRRQEISYTVDTVKFVREKAGNTSLCLLMGADAFNNLHTWKEWQSLLDYVHIVIAERIGEEPQPLNAELTRLIAGHRTELVKDLKYLPSGKIFEIQIPLLDISATRIREIFKNRGNPSYLLPEKVIDYIYSNNIYQTGKT